MLHHKRRFVLLSSSHKRRSSRTSTRLVSVQSSPVQSRNMITGTGYIPLTLAPATTVPVPSPAHVFVFCVRRESRTKGKKEALPFQFPDQSLSLSLPPSSSLRDERDKRPAVRPAVRPSGRPSVLPSVRSSSQHVCHRVHRLAPGPVVINLRRGREC